ncbi:MAG: hypothetical protein QXS53_02325 [Candidatus Anstonellales archaeon]
MKGIYREIFYYLEGLEDRLGNYQKQIAKRYVETYHDVELHHQFARGELKIQIDAKNLLNITNDIANLLHKLTGGKFQSNIQTDDVISVKLSDIQKLLRIVHNAKINVKQVIESDDNNTVYKNVAYAKSNLYNIIDSIDEIIKRNIQKS